MDIVTLGVVGLFAYGVYRKFVANVAEVIEVGPQAFRFLPLREQSLSRLMCEVTMRVKNPTAVGFTLAIKSITLHLRHGSETIRFGDAQLSAQSIQVAPAADTTLPAIKFGIEWARIPAAVATLLKGGEKSVVVQTSALVNGSRMEDAKVFPVKLL